MSDLVKLLRAYAESITGMDTVLAADAADEIERLRAELAELQERFGRLRNEANDGWALANQYKAELAAIKEFAEVGKEMVAITTTVRGPDEWGAIPTLWLECLKERNAAQAELAAIKGQEPVGVVSDSAWDQAVLYRDMEPGTSLYALPVADKDAERCEHHWVLDQEAVRHYCCQKCGEVSTSAAMAKGE